MHARFASRGKSSFFFHPVQLHLELPDLLIELGVERLLVALALVPACRENVGHLRLEAMLPMGDLRGMYTVGTG
jgi:hypothetical protein